MVPVLLTTQPFMRYTTSHCFTHELAHWLQNKTYTQRELGSKQTTFHYHYNQSTTGPSSRLNTLSVMANFRAVTSVMKFEKCKGVLGCWVTPSILDSFTCKLRTSWHPKFQSIHISPDLWVTDCVKHSMTFCATLTSFLGHKCCWRLFKILTC